MVLNIHLGEFARTGGPRSDIAWIFSFFCCFSDVQPTVNMTHSTAESVKRMIDGVMRLNMMLMSASGGVPGIDIHMDL